MKLRVLSPLIWVVSVCVLTLSSCRKGGEEATTQAQSNAKAISVTVMAIQPQQFTEIIQASGTIKAFEDITVTPEEGGVVAEWKRAKGANVKRGDVLAVLKDDILKASYEAAAAQYNIAEMNYAKQEKVYAENAISEVQYRSAGYSRDAAKAQADLMKVRWEHTRIKSPVNGILDERFVDEGEMAAPGVPFARVVNIATVKALINLSERYAGMITRGIPVRLSVAAYRGQIFTGKVNYVGTALAPDNKTFPVEVVIANPGLLLKPEMVAQAEILRASRQSSILIPEDVVQLVDRDRLVVYVEDQGKAHERVVQLGARSGNLIEISQGLAPGDRVVTSGFKGLVDGQPISVVQ